MMRFIWCQTHDYDSEIKALFSAQLSPHYISHSEIQTGRAKDADHWSPDLLLHIQEDIDAAVDETVTDCKLAVVLNGTALAGAAFISIRQAAVPFVALDDFLVSAELRGSGIGGQFLTWLDNEIRLMGITHIFLESGIHNQSAHHFFEHKGFKPVSVTMLKTLTD